MSAFPWAALRLWENNSDAPVLMAPLVVRKEWLFGCHMTSGPGWPGGGTRCERILLVAESVGGRRAGVQARTALENWDVHASGFGPYPVLEGRARCCGSDEVYPETWPEEHLVSCLVGVIGCAGLGTWPQTRDTSCRPEEGLCLSGGPCPSSWKSEAREALAERCSTGDSVGAPG